MLPGVLVPGGVDAVRISRLRALPCLQWFSLLAQAVTLCTRANKTAAAIGETESLKYNHTCAIVAGCGFRLTDTHKCLPNTLLLLVHAH